MKIFIITFIVSILFCFTIYAQCPTGDIQIESQQELDDFLIQYPNCTEISGGLRSRYDLDLSILNKYNHNRRHFKYWL